MYCLMRDRNLPINLLRNILQKRCKLPSAPCSELRPMILDVILPYPMFSASGESAPMISPQAFLFQLL